jgi:cyanophycin synthetase
MNVIDPLEEHAHNRPTANCVYHLGEYYTYHQIYTLVTSLAQTLNNGGIAPGDVVAQIFADDLNQLIAMLATATIGATVFSLPPNLPHTRRRNQITDVNATILLSDDGAEDPLFPSSFKISTKDLDATSTDSTLKITAPAHPWVIVSGSGSTGRPKYLPVLHHQQLSRMRSGVDWLPYDANDTIHSLIRPDFYATKQRYLEAICLGGCIYLTPGGGRSWLDGISEGKLSVLYGTVFHIESLLRHSSPQALKTFHRLNALMVGGSTVSSQLRNRIRDNMTSRLYVLYGSNESNTTTITRLEKVFDPDATVGFPFRNHDLEIVDSPDTPLAAGQAGRIRLRNSGMISSYLQDEDATKKHFRSGWFYPCDIGKINSAGELIFLGREDNMMNMNGINIYPLELETTLLSHPAVKDVIAVPLKNSAQQDIPVCLVQTTNAAAITEPKLLAFARERLDAMSPHRIFLVESIPRNEQGKPVFDSIKKILDSKRHARGSQLKGRFQNRFSVPPNADFQLLDRWLEEVWMNDIPLYPALFGPAMAPANQATLWLIRCLSLARLLMQECSMPVFDLPNITDCRRDDGSDGWWIGKFTLPIWEFYPDNAYRQILANAFELAMWMSTTKISDTSIAECFDRVEERMVKPTKNFLPRGKSSFPILKTAHSLAIPFRHLGKGIYQLGVGSKSFLLDRSTTETDSAIGARISADKSHTASVLQSAGLPAATHFGVTTFDQARQMADKLGWPVVVKPVDGERGEGVSTQVNNYEQLQQAFDYAMENGKQKVVLIERQVAGVCHRLFIANNQLLYAVKRLPPAIVGDGKHTVRDLIKMLGNRERLRRHSKRSPIVPLDDLTREAIVRAGYSLDTILPKDQTLPLRIIETTRWGGIDEEVTRTIHPENIRIAVEAARLFRLQVAGIDIISPDITRPWHQNQAIINEVNYSPLLGGGEVSLSHIPTYLGRLLPEGGVIVIDIVVGGDAAWHAAIQKHTELRKSGINVFLTNHHTTLNPDADTVNLSASGLFARLRALMLQPTVDHIVVVVQTDELLYNGLPFSALPTLTVTDRDLTGFSDNKPLIDKQKVDLLLSLLEEWQQC